jgi:HlyD family secretion protein
MLQKLKQIIIGHKIISIITLILIAVGFYFLFKTKTTAETRYVMGVVQKGDISSTVTGSGQIESLDTVTLSPKASGDITYVGVKVGDYVSSGKLIASIDARDALISLEDAKIALAKLTKSPDTLTLVQRQNSLDKSYTDGWNLVASAVLDATPIVNGLNDLFGNNGYLGSSNIMNTGNSVKDKVSLAGNSYYDAKKILDETIATYKGLSQTSDKKDIENLISKMDNTFKVIANSVKITQTAFDAINADLGSSSTTKAISTQSSLTSWTNTANNYVVNLSSASSSITENNQSLNDLIAGSDALDIKSAQLSVQSKQNAYDDYFVRAPFSGVIASLTAQVGAASGSSIGTLITKQKIATISLNEVDIASIKVGQKVALSFDAIEGLTVDGKVAEIDSVGTVSSGVVSYNVQISFDTQDDRIKPGMSVTASITTDSKQGVLVVPNSAIKTKGNYSYVEAFEIPLKDIGGNQGVTSIILPIQKKIKTGLANNTVTEIVSGLNENNQIITKTIAVTTSTPTTTTTNRTSTRSLLGGSAGGIMGH